MLAWHAHRPTVESPAPHVKVAVSETAHARASAAAWM